MTHVTLTNADSYRKLSGMEITTDTPTPASPEHIAGLLPHQQRWLQIDHWHPSGTHIWIDSVYTERSCQFMVVTDEGTDEGFLIGLYDYNDDDTNEALGYIHAAADDLEMVLAHLTSMAYSTRDDNRGWPTATLTWAITAYADHPTIDVTVERPILPPLCPAKLAADYCAQVRRNGPRFIRNVAECEDVTEIRWEINDLISGEYLDADTRTPAEVDAVGDIAHLAAEFAQRVLRNELGL